MKYKVAHFTITHANEEIALTPLLLQTARDLVAALAGEAMFESFEDTKFGLDGYVQTQLFDRKELDKVLQMFALDDLTVSYTLEDVADKDWNAVWESEGFEPLRIGERCLITDLKHHKSDEKADLEIVIDARLAFGTGTHETTKMMVTELLDMDLLGKCVLDCGCGTGILSIVAARCGAEDIVAYDIDEWSVENAQHNAKLNSVDNLRVLHGDAHVLNNLKEMFDVVVANINRNILLADMHVFVKKMKPNAVLLLSGFYEEDVPSLLECAKKYNLQLNNTKTDKNWTMLRLER